MITEQKPHKLKRILFPVLGAILAAAAIAVVSIQLKPEEPVEAAEPDFHETAEKGTPLTVDYVKPATTQEEYAKLYAACSQFIRTYGTPEGQDPIVEVTEDIFVDAAERPEENKGLEADAYTEYDRAYFEDFLMIRYVSSGGDIRVVGARLTGDNRNEMQLVDQDDFRSEHFAPVPVEEEETDDWKFWLDSERKPEEELEEELSEQGSVSEETFVACVGQCILDILSGTEDELRMLSHFTEEGRASLLRIMQVLKIESDCSVGVVLAEAGVSDPTLETMDRLYLRCELLRGDEATYLNLLVKLNSESVVYDVDTI